MTMPNQSSPSGSKLENASKEDLIKLLKRQQLLFKKNNTENDNRKKELKAESDELKSKIETSDGVIAQLRQENEDIYTSNKKLENEVEELKTSMKRVLDKNEDTSSELLVLRNTKEAMKEVVQKLHFDQSELQKEQSELHQQNSELNRQKNDLEHQNSELLSQLDTEREERSSERCAWQEHIQILQTELQDKQNTLKEYVQKLEEAKQKSSLRSDIFRAKSDISSLRHEGEELKEMIKAYNEQFSRETSTLSQVLSLLESPAIVRSELETVEKEKNELETVEKENIELQSDGECEGNQELSANRDVQYLVNENDMLKEELSSKENDILNHLKEIENLNLKLKDLETINSNDTNTTDDVNTAVITTADANNDASQSYNAETRIKELESELSGRIQELATLQCKLDDLEEDKRKINAHLDSFIDESATMKVETDKHALLTQELEILHSTLAEKEASYDVVTSQLTSLQHQYAALDNEHDQILAQCQTHKDTIKQMEEESNKLGEEKDDLVREKDEMIREKEDMIANLTDDRDSLSSQVFLLEEQLDQVKGDLEAEKARTETLQQSCKETAKDIASKEGDIVKLQKELNEAIENNKKLKEESQGSHNLMDMELADYERAASALEEKLKLSKDDVKQLESELQIKEETINRLNHDIQDLEKQRSNLDEMVTKLKALLLKTKKDAADCRKSEEDAKRSESATKIELEQTIQQYEDSKLELAEVSGKLSSLVEGSRERENEKCALIKNLEQRLIILQEDLQKEKQLRADIGADFESYKIRVHSVLKQQKSSESTVSLVEHEAIVSQLSRELELLKCQVHELKQTKEALDSEKQSLEEELQLVVGNLDRLEKDSTEREHFYLERVGELEETVRKKEEQIYTTVQNGEAQRTALSQSYTRTLEHTNNSHKDAVQVLNARIESLQQQLAVPDTVQTDTTHTDVAPDTPVRPKIRLAAEGMESPSPGVHTAAGLEDLLNSSSSSRLSLSYESSVLELSKEDSKIAHLSNLLSSSEHNAAALQEQCTVLKAEIRRIETMVGRENTNIEYLKNIVIKYLSATDPTSREHLIPVLCTVLHLNKEEKSLLVSSANAGRREQVPWSSSWFSSNS